MATKKSPEGTTNGKKPGSKRKVVIFVIEVLIILIMLVVLYFVTQGTGGVGNSIDEILNPQTGPKVTVIDTEELSIPEEVIQEAEEGSMKGYLNIALFGVDARKDSQLYKGSRSDSTMIASINMDTGDIKLVSVYRDTYLNLGTDKYTKCNAAYSYGGAEQALKMLNMNLDMNIEKFITVSYKGLSEVINGLGGVYIEIDDTELKHINNYQIDIADVLKTDYVPVTETGLQQLDGIQAAAYCRIRYGGGDDYLRASRQREVIIAMESQAKKTDYATLAKVFGDASQYIYTNLDEDTILSMLKVVADYRVVDQDGFPQEKNRTSGNIGAKGSCIVPLNLEDNVIWLHKFLFNDEEYTVSSTVNKINEKIIADTSSYINK